MKCRWYKSASSELIDAATWYEERHSGVGARFLGAASEALKLINESPLSRVPVRVPRSTRVVREQLLKKFPYKIVYEMMRDEIIVVAISHCRRRAFYWKNRTD